jgi:hypothetical protein
MLYEYSVGCGRTGHTSKDEMDMKCGKAALVKEDTYNMYKNTESS